MKEIRPYGETEIEAYAAKVGGRRNLREIIIESEDVAYHYLVKKPGRSVMQAIAAAEQKKDINKAQKLMLGCVLEGDQSAYEYDGSVYVDLLENVSKLAEKTKSSIKKL